MRATVVGICGGSGSGKTTLTRRLVEELGPSQVVSLAFDSYYHDLSHLDPAARAAVNFDHPDSLDGPGFAHDVAALARGECAHVPVYDFASHTRTEPRRRLDPRPLVVIEGILLLAFTELAEVIDHRVFLDVPEAVRFDRRVARDTTERGRTADDVARQFDDSVRPMHDRFVQPSMARADQVLQHGPGIEQNTALVASEVRRLQAGEHLPGLGAMHRS